MTIATISLTPEKLAVVVVGSVAIIFIIGLIIFKLSRRVKPKKFRNKWRLLQKKLPDQAQWRDALQEADNLVDEALKKNKVKGNTMGERLVNAQKQFKDKDEVWFAHKLCKKYQENPKLKLEQKSVKRALVALRQALKDLGAI